MATAPPPAAKKKPTKLPPVPPHRKQGSAAATALTAYSTDESGYETFQHLQTQGEIGKVQESSLGDVFRDSPPSYMTRSFQKDIGSKAPKTAAAAAMESSVIKPVHFHGQVLPPHDAKVRLTHANDACSPMCAVISNWVCVACINFVHAHWPVCTCTCICAT